MTAPFGVPFYSQLSELTETRDLGGSFYEVTPPNKHPLFNQYVVRATAIHGVVWIKGISNIIDNDGFGHATIALVDRIYEQIRIRYGDGKRIDSLLAGSGWEEKQYWMMALNQNERFYYSMWQRPERKTLPEDIETIFVGASANGSLTSKVVLEYASRKIAAADAELERNMSELL